jgi:phosphopentomutase
MWFAFGQSDDWAHADRYDRLLDYLHLVDGLLKELWETLQATDMYRGRTTLILTTDHGRGRTAGDWVEHDAQVPGSEDIWIAVVGPETPDVGEMGAAPTVYQSDIAATILQFFDLEYRSFNPDAGPPIPGTRIVK